MNKSKLDSILLLRAKERADEEFSALIKFLAKNEYTKRLEIEIGGKIIKVKDYRFSDYNSFMYEYSRDDLISKTNILDVRNKAVLACLEYEVDNLIKDVEAFNRYKAHKEKSKLSGKWWKRNKTF